MSSSDSITQESIPPTLEQRAALRGAVAEYVAARRLSAPLDIDELAGHCAAVLSTAGMDHKYLNYAAVLVNNAVWRESVAAVPFDRRLLLLPRCLRNADTCQAEMDEYGLNCTSCGGCVIGQLRQEAMELGYVVLVAEGTPVVMSLVASGKIEAIIGVSCLATLERIFPVIVAASVPGIAIPLLRDGCANTSVDIDWILEAVRAVGGDSACRLSMESMRRNVDDMFSPEGLGDVLGRPVNETERIAHDWLALSGKRWRPFLATCAYHACGTGEHAANGDAVNIKKIALAVECFHKASLVHDDIEDNDSLRYGQQTLHEQYGVPVALNVGDLLLGEGYRMIAECHVSPACKERMLAAAVAGHRCLCAGQGDELLWMRNPKPLTVQAVLDIFSRKTAPAFDVALRLGALAAGAGDNVLDVISPLGHALGVAYQIRDDLDDLADQGQDLAKMKPSLLLAIAYERAGGADRTLIETIWRQRSAGNGQLATLRQIFDALGVKPAAEQMLATYEQQALAALGKLDNANLKTLLRRVIAKIFGLGITCAGNPA